MLNTILNTIALVGQVSTTATNQAPINQQINTSSVQDIYNIQTQSDDVNGIIHGVLDTAGGLINAVITNPVAGVLVGIVGGIGTIVAATSHGPIYTDPVKIWQNSYTNPAYTPSTRQNCTGYNGC